MKELHTDIDIEASAARVWHILTDFPAFPAWNPFIRSINGAAQPGARLGVFIKPAGQAGMTFRPTVLLAEPERELRWLGSLGIPGMFDGEHIFLIQPRSAHQVHFIQRELFRGVLVPLLWHNLETSTRQGFHAMNRALKQRAEQPGIPPDPQSA